MNEALIKQHLRRCFGFGRQPSDGIHIVKDMALVTCFPKTSPSIS
jgi:hypothetical protein